MAVNGGSGGSELQRGVHVSEEWRQTSQEGTERRTLGSPVARCMGGVIKDRSLLFFE